MTSVRLKKIDFKNEYYKEILKKRLHAYQSIKSQIAFIKSVVISNDKRPFHFIFEQGEDKFYSFQNNLIVVISYGLWIDHKTSRTLGQINNLFFNLNNHICKRTNFEIEEIGKEYYNRISELRIQLERDVKKGLNDLHDIKKTFKSKKGNHKRIIYKE